MSYKIEITAETITELTGKLLALAAATQPDVVHGTAQIVPIDTKPKRSGKAAAPANTAAGTGSSTETKTDAAPAEPATQSADVGNAAAPATEQEQTTAKPAELETPVNSLDFDKDVAPVVLNAVKVHTKEWVQEVLSQFGVARASQVPDEQLQELVDALKAGPQ